MSTFFSPSKQEEEDNDDDDEEEDESVVRAKRFWPFCREVPTTHVFQRARAILCCVFVLCVDTVKSEENFETVVLFSLVFFECFFVYFFYYVHTMYFFSQKL